VPAVECTGPADCAADLQCVNGRCVAAPRAQECAVEPIYFDFDQADIRSDARPVLEANARCLKERGTKGLTVEGHCDERGTEEYNMALGDRRARAAKGYLERLGVAGARTVSYGENRPVEPNAESESGHQANRRAEFTGR
jgi:peptidoglycan-associated lipoprotein